MTYADPTFNNAPVGLTLVALVLLVVCCAGYVRFDYQAEQRVSPTVEVVTGGASAI